MTAARGFSFNAEQLVRIDGQSGVFQDLLRLAEGVQGIEHLAFKALHVFQSDVEEVSGSAGGVEDAGGAKLPMKGRAVSIAAP